MSNAGLCQVCEDARARHTCQRCGTQVCTEHWDETIGACSACAETLGDPDGPPTGDDRPDGFRID